jgi:hypothetical protein
MGIGAVVGMNISSVFLNQALGNAAQAVTVEVADKFQVFQVSGLDKADNPHFEKFSKNYINSEPELICVVEYFVDDKSVGALLVWEKFFDSTHYEVFKKNLFKEDANFERILFLDSQSLEEETKNYIDYLKNTVGLDLDENKVFVILDTVVKEDRIYEYKIRASRVPKRAAEVDYDFILESKQLTKQVVVDQNNRSNIFDFAGSVLGSKDLAWTIALLNEKVLFFGKGVIEKPLVDADLDRNAENEEFVLVANNLDNIVTIINESVSLFGVKDTMLYFIKVLGGLGQDFKDSFKDSIDETRNVFSYDKFRESIKNKIPVFSLSLRIAESTDAFAISELSKLAINVPKNTGTESFSNVESITKLVKFVNDTYLACLYSQDNSEKVRSILDSIGKPKDTSASPDTVTQATNETEDWKKITGLEQQTTPDNQVTSQGSSASAAVSSYEQKNSLTRVF